MLCLPSLILVTVCQNFAGFSIYGLASCTDTMARTAQHAAGKFAVNQMLAASTVGGKYKDCAAISQHQLSKITDSSCNFTAHAQMQVCMLLQLALLGLCIGVYAFM